MQSGRTPQVSGSSGEDAARGVPADRDDRCGVSRDVVQPDRTEGLAFHWPASGRNLVRIGEASDWEPARETYRYAEKAARDFANARYARSNPVSVRLVLAKCPAKGRHQFSTRGGRAKSRSSLKHARSANEPWLLACSPGLEHLSAAAIVALYAQRMRIEESFRDTKNLRWGWDWRVPAPTR